MSPRRLVRRTFVAVAILLLLLLTWLGVYGGVHQIPQSHTLGRGIQTVAQLSYGVLSILAVLTGYRKGRWGRLILGGWVVSITIAGGLAPVVWGGASVGIGLVSAAAVVALALGIVWLLRAGLAA